MTCKDCLHNEVCALRRNGLHCIGDVCKHFKPTADVVEVVRCKDCVHYESYHKPVEDFDGKCFARCCETDEQDFCNYGKRKTN